jgi:hypothetical protein
MSTEPIKQRIQQVYQAYLTSFEKAGIKHGFPPEIEEDCLEILYRSLTQEGKPFSEQVGKPKDPALSDSVMRDLALELSDGDRKYGPHPGKNRALGTLKNELMELETELQAEDAAPFSVYEEAIQVLAMAYKFIRDFAYPFKAEHERKQSELKTSRDWLTETKGLVILDPDGWDRKNFYHSFNEEKITYGEFMRRVQISTIRVTPY